MATEIMALNEKIFYLVQKIIFYKLTRMEREQVKIELTDDAHGQIKSYQCPINEILHT